jgi:4-aminobutyrate aminotransferase-like enzyme
LKFTGVKTKTKKVLDLLRAYEPANMLWIAPDGSWPIVWARAKGMNVWDAEGRKYMDLTAAFGVAAAGHGRGRVVAAGQRQMGKLPHAMGDVHPHALKAQLARELSRITFERWTSGATAGKTIFANSGFEAVETCLKTALLATGKRRILAFTGAYHGLGYGALNATHRAYFREPFGAQLGQFGRFVPFPKEADNLAVTKDRVTKLLRSQQFGAILAEPIQGRGGVNVPPRGFLPLLRTLCDQYGALLILDEIFTGFGRTGTWFACEHSRTTPDLICLGKALTGGFPLSACVGRAELMDAAWPPSTGEAIHTSTFQGHPVGCAMALAQIKEIETHSLPVRSAILGAHLMQQLRAEISAPGYSIEVRGRGLMAGLEIRKAGGGPATALVLETVKKMLHRGFILLPEGEFGNVISFTPPLIITKAQIAAMVAALQRALSDAASKMK